MTALAIFTVLKS